VKQLTDDQQGLLAELQRRHGLDRFESALADASPFTTPELQEIDRPIDRPARPRNQELSMREVEVLMLMADGLQNSEIAVELYLAVETIKTHARSIRTKLRARNRTHAVAIGYRSGLLEP
jgi:DNA-binding NarL/FixJ family response regulator